MKRGFAPLGVLFLLLLGAGLAAGVVLVKNGTNFFPKASGGNVSKYGQIRTVTGLGAPCGTIYHCYKLSDSGNQETLIVTTGTPDLNPYLNAFVTVTGTEGQYQNYKYLFVTSVQVPAATPTPTSTPPATGGTSCQSLCANPSTCQATCLKVLGSSATAKCQQICADPALCQKECTNLINPPTVTSGPPWKCPGGDCDKCGQAGNWINSSGCPILPPNNKVCTPGASVNCGCHDGSVKVCNSSGTGWDGVCASQCFNTCSAGQTIECTNGKRAPCVNGYWGPCP